MCELAIFSLENELRRLYGNYKNLMTTILLSILYIVEQHSYFSYPLQRSHDPDSFKDMHDGATIRNLMDRGGFLCKAENTGLILCSVACLFISHPEEAFGLCI